MGKILVIGSSNTDLISKMERFPLPGETIEGNFYVQAMGGKGANQALAAHKLGGKVQFITCLGDDINGANTLNYYKKLKLDISMVIKVPNVSSGTAMIWVDGKGENCIVMNPGSNALLAPYHIEELEEAISHANIVVVQMEIPYETVQKICEIAHRHRTKILLNVAPARKIESETLRKIDILVVNEIEAETISGEKIEQSGEEGVLNKLTQMGAKTVILTLGKKGSIFKNGKTLLRVPAFEVDTVDTTAAGDVFCGALAVGITKGHNWDRTLKFASAAAALSVSHLGAQPSIPTAAEVAKFLDHCNPIYMD